MKTLSVILTLILVTLTLFGQNLLTNPNRYKNGLKEGLWSEFNNASIIDSTGQYRLAMGHHYTPIRVVTEGWYVKSEKQGFWKEYWIAFSGDTVRRLVKVGLKSIIEYKEGVPCGLVVEYHTNGALRAVGQYETYPVNDTLKLMIPNWKKDPDGSKGIMKDTIIYIRAKSRPIGTWQFFRPDGTVWK